MDINHGTWESAEDMATDAGEGDGGLRRLKKRTRPYYTGFPGHSNRKPWANPEN